MKIIDLDIKNVRGIKNISLTPNGQSLVVFGPNGTGKSAIVDAVDFLLTGQISRLTGEGTKSLSLKEHGCHVDYRNDLKNASVVAEIEVEGKRIIIERNINKPSNLRIKPKGSQDMVRKHLAVTEVGQHILTRRDILEYVNAEAGKRAKKVMSLLNLEYVESLRSIFVTIRNEATEELGEAQTNLELAKQAITTILDLEVFSEETVLNRVNEMRRHFNGHDLQSLSADVIKKDLTPPPFTRIEPTLTADLIRNITGNARRLLLEKKAIVAKEAELRAIWEAAAKETDLKKCILYKNLLEIGINFIDDSNTCPLCGRKWEGDFKQYLIEKEKEIELSRQKLDKIAEISNFLHLKLEMLKEDIAQCVSTCRQAGLDLDEKELDQYIQVIATWLEAIDNPVEFLEEKRWPSASLESVFASLPLDRKLLTPLEEAAKSFEPKFPKELSIWDALTKMEDRWQRYAEASQKESSCTLFKKRADIALDCFERSRDSVLESIYDAIKCDFEAYYKELHSEDESNFVSKISPAGPELNFEVDFYGRGMFPPNALHSEGHQDSMGLCLFFALNKYLVKNMIEVVILDDVVMSIDSSHRRGICRLLRDYLSNKQFIITTHDAAWARQLRTEGIVKQENMVHFTNWNIETGPIYEMEKDLWGKIDECLTKDNVPAAAHLLRRNSELFFEDVCDLLGATIKYKGNHQWELGDLAQAAISTYRRLLKRATINAKKAGQSEKLKELEALDTKSSKTIAQSQIEQWIVNENVHYNKWKEYNKNDFEPVAEAFKQLFALFTCSSCQNPIILNEDARRTERASVSCKCGQTYWDVSD